MNASTNFHKTVVAKLSKKKYNSFKGNPSMSTVTKLPSGHIFKSENSKFN